MNFERKITSDDAITIYVPRVFQRIYHNPLMLQHVKTATANVRTAWNPALCNIRSGQSSHVHEALVNSSALYCSETWSWAYNDTLNAIDTKSARNFLKTSKGEGSGVAARSLHGRTSLAMHRDVAALSYWFRMVSDKSDRLNRVAFENANYRNNFKKRIKICWLILILTTGEVLEYWTAACVYIIINHQPD